MKQILIIHQSTENHQGQIIMNAPRSLNVFLVLKGGNCKLYKACAHCSKQKRSTEGCSKFKGPETRQVQKRLVSTLEHMQVPKWDRTRCPEE